MSGCNLVTSIASFICIIYLNSGVSQVRKDSSRTQVHKVAQFYRKRLQGVSERSKKAADTEFAGGYSVILILVCVSASLRFRFLT